MIQILLQNPHIHWADKISIVDLTIGTGNGLKVLFSQLGESAKHYQWTKGYLSSPRLYRLWKNSTISELDFPSLFSEIQIQRKTFIFLKT